MVVRSPAGLALVFAALGVQAERPDGKARLERLNLKSKGSSAILGEETQGAGQTQDPAAGPLLQAEIDRARAAETVAGTNMSALKDTILANWDTQKTFADSNVVEMVVEDSDENKVLENATTLALKQTTDNFELTKLAGLQNRSTTAEAARDDLAAQMGRIWSSLRHHYCPPPAADARGTAVARVGSNVTFGCAFESVAKVWEDQGGVADAGTKCASYKGLVIEGDEASPWNTKYSTFEEAWAQCAETKGCSQVMQMTSTAGEIDLGQGAGAVSVSGQYDGFYLRSRSEMPFKANAVFDWSYFASQTSADGVTASASLTSTFAATDYACNQLCPAACKNGLNTCPNCATTDEKSCTTCQTDTLEGCAGNCVGKVDCSSCPLDVTVSSASSE